MDKCIYDNIWDEITHSFLNFGGCNRRNLNGSFQHLGQPMFWSVISDNRDCMISLSDIFHVVGDKQLHGFIGVVEDEPQLSNIIGICCVLVLTYDANLRRLSIIILDFKEF